MQKDNDQRTDKDLEVEEYLSQFGADEEVQDDTDISSFRNGIGTGGCR